MAIASAGVDLRANSLKVSCGSALSVLNWFNSLSDSSMVLMILLLLVKLGELYYNQIMKTQNGQMPTIILSDYQIMDNVSEVDEYFEDQ